MNHLGSFGHFSIETVPDHFFFDLVVYPGLMVHSLEKGTKRGLVLWFLWFFGFFYDENNGTVIFKL